jgi:uncharacterized membrane protein YgcG
MKNITSLLFLAVSLYGQTVNCYESISPTFNDSFTAGVRSLQYQGADVKVLVFPTISYPTLDFLRDKILRDCQTWQSPRGGMKNNLIAIMVSLSPRRDAIYFGDQWKPMLDSQYGRIRSQVMEPRFRENNISGGIDAGLKEIARVIVMPANAGAPLVVNQPTDLSGLWRFLEFLLYAVGAFTALWYIAKIISKKNRERDDRTGAQQGALIAQQEATSLVAESSSWGLEGDPKKVLDAAIESYSQLGYGAMDPQRNGLTAQQYKAIESRYREAIQKIEAAKWGQKFEDSGKNDPPPSPEPHNPKSNGEPFDASRIKVKPIRHVPRVEREVVHEIHNHYVDPVYPAYNQNPVFVPVVIPMQEYPALTSTYIPTTEPEHTSWPASDPEPSSGGGGDSSFDTSSSSGGGGDSGGGDCGGGDCGGGGDGGF